MPAILLAWAGAAATAGPVTLEWDPEPDAIGYRIYYGTSPGQ